jgi:hypothetical protein
MASNADWRGTFRHLNPNQNKGLSPFLKNSRMLGG